MATWNVSGNANDDYDLRNRTNNALECYNRRLNSFFPSPHPSLPHFVQKIEEESRYQAKRLDDMRYGRVVVPESSDAIIEDIPAVYVNFSPSTVSV